MKTVVLIPCMDSVATEFAESLVKMRPVGSVGHAFHSCSLIYKARNDLGTLAVNEKTDFALWLDSDILFPGSLLVDLMADMKDRDIVTGICHMRRPPFRPAIWSKLRQGLTPEEAQSEAVIDYPPDEIFEVEGSGLACMLMRTEVLKTVMDTYHDLFAPLPGYGEDLSFCLRARGCGYKIWCDPRIQVGHKASTIVTADTFRSFREAGGLGEEN